ncbi:energy-coupling factor ABC transporter substrate-binding protein [Fusobacterium russii]|uniref:energy-coupling factor ABC transporter substrate-binding protein n=1 Tax=Fusobacterium russii TaxID=854 RepID=UPI0003999A17|nr:energy-coupling factor ABC transporter substrate-binding protein [Fusobacterium russii]
MEKSILKKNLLLLLLVIILAIFPLVYAKDSEFGGADGQAEELITEIKEDYEPWFESFWEPPSGEIESLLFALQAAIGAGFVCGYIGYIMGKHKGKEK